METIKYNVVKAEKYRGKDGSEKTKWHKLGVMTEFHKPDGSISRMLEIPAISLVANLYPFEKKEDVSGYGKPKNDADVDVETGSDMFGEDGLTF